jgi:hypothetical protein
VLLIVPSARNEGDGDWKSHSELLERLESQVEERKEIVRREETRVEAAAEARRKVEGERDEAAAVVDEVRVRLGHAMENGPQVLLNSMFNFALDLTPFQTKMRSGTV